ncbi:MAG: hypothetical protein QOE13_3419, partial [Gaiellaceae bacterium]|nr:hypothetical protein [Gaiellaceae bacterium]
MTERPRSSGVPVVDEEALRRHLDERREAIRRSRRRTRRLAGGGGIVLAAVAAVTVAIALGSDSSAPAPARPSASTAPVTRSVPSRPAAARRAAARPRPAPARAPLPGAGVLRFRSGRSSTAPPPALAPNQLPAGAQRPAIVQRPIPFGPERKAQMTAYSRTHYGSAEATWVLTPRVIVEHYTAGTSFSSAWNTFAANSPDRELGQLPGTCAQFVIDTDGTIYQLVPTTVRCRHTVGLNHVAIGIEHVGTSDAQILDNPRQLAASLSLTRWLMATYGIATADVIGHAESLSS